MAKLSKKIRKSAAKAASSQFTRDVLEKLVTAALLAAAAKLADSPTADRLKRKAERAFSGKKATSKTKARGGKRGRKQGESK